MADKNLLPRAVHVIRCALADLEGIMPEVDPSGDRVHPGWQTMREMIEFLKDASQDTTEYQGRYPYLGLPFENKEISAT